MTPRTTTLPPRLIDLHCNWLLQYAGETTTFDPALYSDISSRIVQVEGYLTGVSAAVLACHRRPEDWAAQPDRWGALDDLISRIEAEFPGRLLIGPDDFRRWSDEPEGLCWGVIGIEGFDFLIREADDLGRVRPLLERGVRWFQPVHGPDNALGGSSAPGDDRGMTPLGLAFLEILAERSDHASSGHRPILDLARLNPRSMSEVLDWFEADGSRMERMALVHGHGASGRVGFDSPGAISTENLRRLRALGGTVGFSVGPPFFETSESLRAAIEDAAALPFRGTPGFEGIAIGSDFLGIAKTLPELADAGRILQWLTATFHPPVAEALSSGNARNLFLGMLGGGRSEPAAAAD